MENENRKLHEWLFHDILGPEWTECRSTATDHITPRYNEESGFFALLSGLRAKGFGVRTVTAEDVSFVWLRRKHGDEPYPAHADTLPLALFNAAIKAMEAGGTE